MINRIVALAVSLMGVLSCSAQERFAIKIGLNIANERHVLDDLMIQFPHGDNDFLFDPTVEPYLGISYDLPVNKSISIRTEIAYMGTGYDGQNYENIFFPLSVQYHANNKFSLLVGAYMSCGFGNSNLSGEGTRFDFGPRFGVEYLLKDGVGFGIQYCWGIIAFDQGFHPFYTPEGANVEAYSRGLQMYFFKKISFKRASHNK
jgi:hypothetical protein